MKKLPSRPLRKAAGVPRRVYPLVTSSGQPLPDDTFVFDATLAEAPLRHEVANNSPLLGRATAYRKELPGLMQPSVVAVREFFLTQAVPMLTAVHTGLLDGSEVVALALDDKPAAEAFNKKLVALANTALLSRSVVFISNLFRLSHQEAALYLHTHLSELMPASAPDMTTQLRGALEKMVSAIPAEDQTIAPKGRRARGQRSR